MNIGKGFTIILILLLTLKTAFSQSFIYPNYALKSHPTLDITKAEISSEKSVFYLTVENRIEGGMFCADKNIYLIGSDGVKLKLEKSSGIPVCPDNYRFKNIGEKLSFVLVFPPLNQDVRSISIIEECSENCFSFYGIVLDSELNIKINEAFLLAEDDEPEKALAMFMDIAEDSIYKDSGAEGILYISIIKLARETGKASKAAEWYNKLKTSGIYGMELYLNTLNLQGINY